MRKKAYFFVAVFALSLFFAPKIHAARLRMSPASGSFILGSTFDVSIILNTEGIAINTVEAEINFPPEKLQLVNPSLGKSVVQIWASPPTYSNTEGRIYLVGGIPSPGINTSEGIVQSFTFRVIAPGEAKISFGESTSVLANDGLGTDVLAQVAPARFSLILPIAQGPEIFSSTHPEQGTWYKDPNPILSWDASPQSEGFSVEIDHDSNGVPDTEIDVNDSQTSYSGLESGVWYFHVREKAGGSWGGVSHFILNIDTIPPAAFGIKASPSLRTSDKSPVLRFFTTDSLSGFDHFEIKIVSLKTGVGDTTFFFEAISPHQILGIDSGRYEIIVRAYDIAKNYRDESVTLNIVSSPFGFITSEGVDFILFFAPWNKLLPTLIVLLIIGGILTAFVLHRHHHHVRHIIRHDLGRKNIKTSRRKAT